jgi:hypothetical protein
MFQYMGNGVAGLITAFLILGLIAALIAGPRVAAGKRLLLAGMVWGALTVIDFSWFIQPRNVNEGVALSLAALPIVFLGTARTIVVAAQGASALIRVANFFLSGTIGVLLYPVLLLLTICVIAHSCL